MYGIQQPQRTLPKLWPILTGRSETGLVGGRGLWLTVWYIPFAGLVDRRCGAAETAPELGRGQ